MIKKSDLEKINTNEGNNLADLSEEKIVMLIFLRHFGCIFCREALKEVASRKNIIDNTDIKIIFAHMSDNETAESYFKEYGLEGVEHISDPECEYYAQFGLTKGNFKQLFGFQNWVKGFELHVTGMVKASFQQIGDGFQMPGIFLIQNSEIKESYIHDSASDKPDYDQLIKCCV